MCPEKTFAFPRKGTDVTSAVSSAALPDCHADPGALAALAAFFPPLGEDQKNHRDTGSCIIYSTLAATDLQSRL